MRKLIMNKKGEGYVDVAVTILIVSFVLIFSVNMVSLVALNQNIKTAADRIAEYPPNKERQPWTDTLPSCQARWESLLTVPLTEAPYTMLRARCSSAMRSGAH